MAINEAQLILRHMLKNPSRYGYIVPQKLFLKTDLCPFKIIFRFYILFRTVVFERKYPCIRIFIPIVFQNLISWIRICLNPARFFYKQNTVPLILFKNGSLSSRYHKF